MAHTDGKLHELCGGRLADPVDTRRRTARSAAEVPGDLGVGRRDGAGFVTRFHVDSDFLSRCPVQQAGGRTILELWVPADELDEFNAHIVGGIEVVHEFR